ncbi:MAG: ABC transporter ATP-binding protein, partial [Deltaproteobacteria bacterium]|nr:ABC transporter ATP-binding protein [Deltaproteobacteria bacterium]
MTEGLLKIRGLKTVFASHDGTAAAVDGLDLELSRGETLGLVGESGCGKSVTALSIMRLVPSPQGRIESGEILLDSVDLLRLSPAEMRRVRGNDVSMIFQEPMTSLNPVFRVGDQIAEVFRLHRGMNNKEAAA